MIGFRVLLLLFYFLNNSLWFDPLEATGQLSSDPVTFGWKVHRLGPLVFFELDLEGDRCITFHSLDRFHEDLPKHCCLVIYNQFLVLG